VTLLALVAVLAATAPAASAETLKGARTKALKATKSERAAAGTILFSLPKPVREGSSIRQSGKRPPEPGSTTRTMPSVMTVSGEPAYFFYLDKGAYQDYQHAGRVVLVGTQTGHVRRSSTLQFAPTINGRLPVFLRSSEAYELPAYHVASKAYRAPGAARAARAGLLAFGAL